MERLFTNYHSSPLHHLQTTMALVSILHHSQTHSFQLCPWNPNPFIALWGIPTRPIPTHTIGSTHLHFHTRWFRHQTPSTDHRSRWEHHPLTHLLPHSHTPWTQLCPPPQSFPPPTRMSVPTLSQPWTRPNLFISPCKPALGISQGLLAAPTHT